MSNDKFDTARQVLRQQKLTGERALFQSEIWRYMTVCLRMGNPR